MSQFGKRYALHNKAVNALNFNFSGVLVFVSAVGSVVPNVAINLFFFIRQQIQLLN